MEITRFRKIVLSPLSTMWSGVYRLRRALYDCGVFEKSNFRVPIVSVGNITFGGTGKTPFTLWLTSFFEQKGLTTAILTRGYRGKYENRSGIIKSGQIFRSNPIDYGDEPLLLSRRLTRGAVIVGKNRAANLKRYFPEVEPDIVLLDDGFQHLKLNRNYNIVLFDSLLPMDSYKTAPAGYLREGLTALKDADAIVFSRCDQVSSDKIKELKLFLSRYHRAGIPIVQIRYEAIGLSNTDYQPVMTRDELKGKKVIAVAALASPRSFYNLLEDLGAEVDEKCTFPDHYFFTADDINNLLIKATQYSAIVVTTEKDIVKIRKITQEPKFLYVDIQIGFMEGKDELEKQLSRLVYQ